MIDLKEIFETQHMIDREHLDIRTITMGISLRDCAHSDVNTATKRYTTRLRIVRNGSSPSART